MGMFAIFLVSSLAFNACVAKRETVEKRMEDKIQREKERMEWNSCRRTEQYGGYYQCLGKDLVLERHLPGHIKDIETVEESYGNNKFWYCLLFMFLALLLFFI